MEYKAGLYFTLPGSDHETGTSFRQWNKDVKNEVFDFCDVGSLID